MNAERRIVALVGAIQFVHVVDFMMIMPLGPDFTEPLGIPPASLGLLAAAYTGAAAVVGLAAAPTLDRFDRRTVALVALSGLALATLAGALATGMGTMLLARGLAGAFGGPAAAIGQSILTDAVPAARRGRAMGAVMGANAVAAVAGVPIGLWLADAMGWQAPFVGVGLAAFAVTLLAGWMLPSMTDHRTALASTSIRQMVARPVVRDAYALVLFVVVGSFLLTPNLSAYIQLNLGFPREDLPGIYSVAGGVALVTMQLVGRLVDRFGAVRVGSLAATGFGVVIVSFLLLSQPLFPVAIGVVLLLVSLSSRNIAVRTLTTQVPGPAERARFMSLQSSVHHSGAACGAVASTLLLTTAADGSLQGMGALAVGSLALTCALPLLLLRVARGVDDECQPSAALR